MRLCRSAGLLGIAAWSMLIGANAARAEEPLRIVLRPAAVFDGEALHRGWVVVTEGDRISAAGAPDQVKIPQGARVIDLPGQTLLPGMV